ncbi:MAG: hypothetical protein ACOX4L_06720 [Bacillota bacterium]
MLWSKFLLSVILKKIYNNNCKQNYKKMEKEKEDEVWILLLKKIMMK